MVNFRSGFTVASDNFLAISILESSMGGRLDSDSDPLMLRLDQNDQTVEMKIRGSRVLIEREGEEAGTLGCGASSQRFVILCCNPRKQLQVERILDFQNSPWRPGFRQGPAG